MTAGTTHLDFDKPLDVDKLCAARLLAVRARPYLATALHALHMWPSPVPWAVAAIWSACCRAMPRHGSCTHCARRTVYRWSAAEVRICAGFAEVLRAQHRPDVIVVLTDGHTPWPNARPACRTVVGLFDRQPSWDEDDPDHVPSLPPTWVRVVRIG